MSSISKINIDQQLAEIGVKVTPAKVHITYPHPEMRISTESPRMEIESKNPSFTINRKKINSESGLKSPTDLAKDLVDNGKKATYTFTSTTSNDGEFLGDTTKPGNRIAQLSKRKTLAETFKKELNIGTIPKSLPEVVWDPGYMRVNWSKHSILIEWEGEYMPELAVDPPYSVEIFLRNKPYFRITVIDETKQTGGHVVDRVL